MVTGCKIINISITNKFEDVWIKFLELMNANKEFNRLVDSLLTKTGEKDKRFKQHNRRSAAVRYIISKYVQDNWMEYYKSKIKKDDTTKNNNIQANDDGK